MYIVRRVKHNSLKSLSTSTIPTLALVSHNRLPFFYSVSDLKGQNEGAREEIQFSKKNNSLLEYYLTSLKLSNVETCYYLGG